MSGFAVGQTVELSDERIGVVRFVGTTDFSKGEWVGVELEEATGKNDGQVNDRRYFTCAMGYGMFLRPTHLQVIAEAPAPVPAPVRTASSRKSGRPSSLFSNNAAVRTSGVTDAGLNKRMSLNAPSPSPGPKSRPTSIARSPTKSPTKQLATSSTSSSRTATPSNTRVASVGAKPRVSVGTTRTSMGPPPLPGSKVARQSSVSSIGSRVTSGGPSRAPSGRTSLVGSKILNRVDTTRRPSADSQAGSHRGDDGERTSPTKANGEILSPQPKSPVLARTNALEKLTAAAGASAVPSPTTSARPSVATSSRAVGGAAATREIEDLKAKIRVLEKKRMEDRDKLKTLDKIQEERNKFHGIIERLQQKYQPQQQEVSQLRKQLKEAETKFSSIEDIQQEHETMMEIATLDKEMAEEELETAKLELSAAQSKVEELTLELEIAKAELSEFLEGVSEQDRDDVSYLQLQRENQRYRDALVAYRDKVLEREADLKAQIKLLEEEVRDFATIKEQYEQSKEKLERAESAISNLQAQLDDVESASDVIEELSNRNNAMSEQINELRAVIEDLESLKEINDELEINHVQNEKEMQEELDFKDNVITEQARRAGQQEANLEDMEYSLSKFRELVTNLRNDLEDMRASHAVTETESEQLNSRSRAMMDLNLKLQISAAKTQVKTIDLELRRLEAQEAEQHLEIVKLFLPDSYKSDQNSVLTLLRFRRLAFKSHILQGFVKDRINGQPHPGHEDDIFFGCDAIDKLTWVAAMCERFSNDMSHCSPEEFSKYESAVHELEPVERALNSWVDGLRRDDFKEEKCASELQRTIALLSHLGEVHISDDLRCFADRTHMQSLNMMTHLDSAAATFGTIKDMVQRVVPTEGEDHELAQHFAKRAELAIGQTRSAKVIANKAVRALEELKMRSLSLLPDSNEAFDQCEEQTQELANLSRQMGLELHAILNEEGRVEPYTYIEVQNTLQKTVLVAASSSESDVFSTYLAKLRVLTSQITDLAALCSDLDQTQEFDSAPAPWRLRAQELRALKTVPVDAEEELRRLREEHNEARRTIAQRDENLSTATLKIETLEARMKDANAKASRMAELEAQIETAKQQNSGLKEDIEKQDRELKTLEADRDKWKKIAGDSRAFADGTGAAGLKAGQERAVATAREMDALKSEIASLQAAVRYLREDNHRARLTEQHSHGWLAEPLKKPAPIMEQRKALLVAEGKDVLGELVRMATNAKVYDLTALPEDKLAWRPAKKTPQHHAARQAEDYAAWKGWQDAVLKKSEALLARQREGDVKPRVGKSSLARLQIRLPGAGGKMVPGSGRGVQIVGSSEWEALQGHRVASV